MFAGLKGLDFNSRYLDLLRKRIFGSITQELRLAYGREPVDRVPVSDLELEAISFAQSQSRGGAS